VPTEAEEDPFAAFRSHQQGGAMLKSMGLGRGAFESGILQPAGGRIESQPALSRGWFAQPEFTGVLVQWDGAF